MVIYKATNRINGKVYIGQSQRVITLRKCEHIRNANNGYDYYLESAIRKYGTENFKWEVIKVCKDIEELNEKEVFYIAFYNSFGKRGYNLTSGGKNYIRSDGTRKKMSINRLGKRITEKHKKHISENSPKYWLGKKMSIKHCNNLRIARLNMSDETKEKMRQAQLGKHRTESTKKKMEIAQQKRRIREKMFNNPTFQLNLFKTL